MKKLGILSVAMGILLMGSSFTYVAQAARADSGVKTTKVSKQKANEWDPHYVQIFDGLFFNQSALKWKKLDSKEQIISIKYIMPMQDGKTYVLTTNYRYDLKNHKCWVKNVENMVYPNGLEERGRKVTLSPEEVAVLQDKSDWLVNTNKRHDGIGAEKWVEIPNDNIYAGFAYYMLNRENWSNTGWDWQKFFADNQ